MNNQKVKITLIKGSTLLWIAYKRLKEIEVTSSSRIIKFPSVSHKLCTSFQMKKEYIWPVLYELREAGLIEIFPFHGVKIIPLDAVLTRSG